MKKKLRLLSLLFMGVFLLMALSATAQAAINLFPFTGEIERITVNNDNGIYSSGTMVVAGQVIILPKNLLIDLPANRLTLKQIFEQAPAACVALNESGLAKADRCNSMGAGGNATISANFTNNGNVIAGDVFIQKGIEAVTGFVTYINYAEGYVRLNGNLNDATTGLMVRLNDPDSRHTIQSGAGCTTSGPANPNCSPDPRFTLDPDNYTNTYTTGYPYCIPSTLSRQFPGLPAIPGVPEITPQLTAANPTDGTGDLLCPSTNRPAVQPVPDSRRFAPIKVGDGLTVEGNFETINGVRFLSAHSSTIGSALKTGETQGQPDYLFLDEVEVDAPGFNNERARTLFIGYATRTDPATASADVDLWTIHRDPITNAIHEFPLASVRGCDLAAGAGTCGQQGLGGAAGNNIWKIRHDVDFLVATDAKLSPCAHLSASPRFAPLSICGGTPTQLEEFAILSPIPHEIMARTGRKIDSATVPSIGALNTIDINGATATNGEYLFPFGLNLGGISVPEFVEIDLNNVNSALIFEGIPWNLDRRLSPGGCMNDAGDTIPCPLGTVGSTTYRLDPFPYSGLDPRFQASLPTGNYNDPTYTASLLTDVRDRVRSYVADLGGGNFNFNGNSSLVTYQLGVFPPDPAHITILPTPVLNIFPPIAVPDSAPGVVGVAVNIPVLNNDVPVLGTIDATTVTIVASPATGIVAVLPDGSINFTPAATGVMTFTYTVANNFGSVSIPALVTVTTASNTFTITASAGANGTIAPSGAVTVNNGAVSTFTVTPDAGFQVASLVVDGVTIPATTSYTFVNVTGNHTISANFAASPVITAAAGPNGTISPAGATTVTLGANQTYTITPNAGFMVVALSVDGVVLPAATSYTFTNVTATHAINAYFDAVPATITITAAAGPGGTISPVGANAVAGGSSPVFTITPDPLFMVTALSVDGVVLPAATSYTFTNVIADHAISAYFAPVPATVTITASAGPGGTISPAGINSVAGGSSPVFTITPDAGLAIAALVVDGVVLPAAPTFTFTNVSADHYINAYFQ
jgi:hypothetical protein